MSSWENNPEIQIFREYLRIPSVHPNIDYEPCVEFIKKQAKSLDLPVSIHYPASVDKPVVVLTWIGTQPNLQSIVLNSHMDVVPVFPEHWTHPPFAAEIDSDGKIFARGTQDMKSVGVQYLAAIRALKKDGVKQLKRTVYITFVPDEEIGGHLGMDPFVLTNEFKAMNVGFAMDEGDPSATDECWVLYGEKIVWQIEFRCRGKGGHASLFVKKTPGEKIHYIIDKFMTFRKEEVAKLINFELEIGDVTTVNLNILKGGTQVNVIPPKMSVVFDIRIANDVDLEQFEQMIYRWCEEAGGDIEVIFIQKEPKGAITAIDSSNPFWMAFKSAVDEMNVKIKTKIDAGGSDMRFIRLQNLPALGFMPIYDVKPLLHNHDEYIPVNTYLHGIQIYKKVISNIANA